VANSAYTEDQKQASRSVEIETLKAQSHSTQLTKESAEKSEMHAQISSLIAHRDTLSHQNSSLHTELRSLQSTLTARKEAQQKHARYLSSQSRHNIPELGFWEDYLCMRIEGAGVEDRLRFVFSHVIEKDWEREGWFELDTSARDYRVTKTVPKLDTSEVEAVVETMNESRELGPFFKEMREAFVRALK
jgi:kinetochore protein Spc25